MHITEVVSNRLELDYDEEKDGETFLMSTISDQGKAQLCRINLDTLPALKNFVDLSFQFMQKCKQEREKKSEIALARSQAR